MIQSKEPFINIYEKLQGSKDASAGFRPIHVPHQLTKPEGPAAVAQPHDDAASGAKEETLELRSVKFNTEVALPETQTQVGPLAPL